MSWEAVAEELEGLLATRCERVLPTAEAVALVQDEGGFCAAVDGCGALPPPSSQERSRLISVLQNAGSKLEALDAGLAPPLRRLARGQQSPASDAALVQIHMALFVLLACSNVAAHIQCTPAEAAGLARALQLLTGSGAAAALAAAAGHMAAAGVMPEAADDRHALVCAKFSMQAEPMQRLLGLAHVQEGGRLGRPAAEMVGWLEAMAAMLAKLGPEGLPETAQERDRALSHDAQTLLPSALVAFCAAVALLKVTPEYSPALQAAPVARCLADALLPWLPRLAAAVGDASEGKHAPLSAADWRAVDFVGQVLMAVRPAFDKDVCAEAAEGGSRPLQLLQQAAQLAAHWPQALAAGVAPAVAENLALASSFVLAGIAGNTHNGQIPWLQQHAAEPACTALRRQQGAALLPVVPSLRAGLRAVLGQAVAQKRAQQCASIVDSFCGILSLLKQTSHPWLHTLNERGEADPASQAAASLDEVPAWCAAASDALAVLAVWPEVEAAFGGAPPNAQPALRQRLGDLARVTLAFVSNAAWVATILVFTKVEAGEELEAEPGAALQAALWQLHSTLLRLQHFALPTSGSAAAAAGQVLPALFGDACLMLLELYTRVFKAACGAAELCPSELDGIPEAARLPPEEDEYEPEVNSTLLALQAAHWEAVAAALPACGAAAERLPPGPGPGDVRFGCITDSVVACVRAGAVLFTPAMRTVINEAFELRPEQDPFKRFMLYGSLADATALSPALAAALLADGLVEVLLADLTGEASVGDHRIPEPQCRSIAESLSRGWAGLCDEGRLVAEELASASQQPAADSSAAGQQQPTDAELAAGVRAALAQVEAARQAGPGRRHIVFAVRWALPGMCSLAVALDKVWGRPEQQVFAAQVAAARSCAYLRCANLSAEGGPAAGAGGKKCSRCRVAHYCGTACSHADWKSGGHKRMCSLLAAAQAELQE